MLSSRIAIAAGAAATAGVAYLYFRKKSKDSKGFGAMLLCKAFLFFEEKKGLTPREQELWVEATDKRGIRLRCSIQCTSSAWRICSRSMS